MTTNDEDDVTELLGRIRAGDARARNRLFERVYDEMLQIAHHLVPEVGVDRTQATALVDEAAARLLRPGALDDIKNRRHFFAVAAKAIRRILIDDWRKKKKHQFRPLPADLPAKPSGDVDEVLLDQALRKLEGVSPRMAQIIELRRYGGLTNKEIAELLGVSLRTVEKDTAAAKAWLFRELKEEGCG